MTLHNEKYLLCSYTVTNTVLYVYNQSYVGGGVQTELTVVQQHTKCHHYKVAVQPGIQQLKETFRLNLVTSVLEHGPNVNRLHSVPHCAEAYTQSVYICVCVCTGLAGQHNSRLLLCWTFADQCVCLYEVCVTVCFIDTVCSGQVFFHPPVFTHTAVCLLLLLFPQTNDLIINYLGQLKIVQVCRAASMI